MKFSTALIAGMLSASSVIAAPGTAARRERTIKRRSAGAHLSKPMIPANFTGVTNGPENAHVEYSNNWAGAALVGSGYTSVTGTFTVPSVSLPSGGSTKTAYSASAWVGLDGYTCETAILQTGIDFTLQNGKTTYDAWYEWYPDYAYDFSGITFSAGQTVKLTITATSKSAGTATIENVSTGKTVSHSFSGESDALCETNAEWIVEDYESGSSLVNLVNFGTVTFTGASAGTSGGSVSASGAQIVDMVTSSNAVEASASVSGSTVVVKHS